MALSSEHQHFLIVKQGLVPAIFNFVLNGALAWLILRHNDFLTLWGEGATGPDLLITGFLLAFLSCVIVTPLVTRQIRSGEIPLLGAIEAAAPGMHTRSLMARASLLGVLGIVFGALPTVGLLNWFGVEPMTVGWFVTFKAIWTGLLAAAITPVIAWWALRAASCEATR
ncbi:MAG: hypothetical protein GY910_01895 [bacterium]|nr:hypothetical protein [Deltaproteobacteria bacterium]MCP4903705.1 hypothetical protein [bacterium]